MPCLDVIIRTMFTADGDALQESIISRYILGSLTLIFLALLMMYIIRIFNICVPAELIPWCSPIS